MGWSLEGVDEAALFYVWAGVFFRNIYILREKLRWVIFHIACMSYPSNLKIFSESHKNNIYIY